MKLSYLDILGDCRPAFADEQFDAVVAVAAVGFAADEFVAAERVVVEAVAAPLRAWQGELAAAVGDVDNAAAIVAAGNAAGLAQESAQKSELGSAQESEQESVQVFRTPS